MNEEKWVPVAPNDAVFDTGWTRDGRVVGYNGPPYGIFGAIVRLRDGRWQKRMMPLVILARHDFTLRAPTHGRDLPVPRR